MTLLRQINISIGIGIFIAAILFLLGVILPALISSKLPILAILCFSTSLAVGLFLCLMGLFKLIAYKKTIIQPKRKCYEKTKRKTESKSKRPN